MKWNVLGGIPFPPKKMLGINNGGSGSCRSISAARKPAAGDSAVDQWDRHRQRDRKLNGHSTF